MRNYVIINGVNSLDIQGLAINNLPPITKPMIRTQREEIDGRDGDLITELGYSAYDKQIEIGLWGTYDINDIIKYFTGEGTIVFSNEEDKYYNFKILDQIDYEKLLKFKTATITFHCQPFKYPLEEEPVEAEITTLTGTGETITLNNTEKAPMSLVYKGNTQQNGTPTPDSPIPIQVVTGDNSIVVSNGTQSASYPINLGDIELLKIGTYQDYLYKNSGKWYKYSAIGKVVLKGSGNTELWGNGGTATNYWEYQRSGIVGGNGMMSDVKTNYFNQTYNSRVVILGNGGLYLRFPKASGIDISNATLMNNWLSTHNTIVYYVLATPTYTEIEDTTLINQLETIKKSYEGQTNITQVNNDMPFELDVSVAFLTPMEINNIGNIYAKPILTIEGTGNIGVVLNDIQILDIDLTNNGKIAIDVTKLEAYNPDDDTLLNRLVTGDYMKLLINEGENTITFTGNVSGATLTNYIRWI